MRPDFLVQREISIHAPPRGATGTCECCITTVDFNSRPSARGDGAFWYDDWFGSISIHAPPRGATTFADLLGSARRLFQFTPLREGRLARAESVLAVFVFQFTPLREGRRRSVGDRFCVCISIHAPPRGATHQPRRPCDPDDFNSRPSARGDFAAIVWNSCVPIFQFTPLREGRHAPKHLSRRRGKISIHAPPRGATCPPILILFRVRFQFTPLREGRREEGST